MKYRFNWYYEAILYVAMYMLNKYKACWKISITDIIVVIIAIMWHVK